MSFRLDKDDGRKKAYIIAKDDITERKFEIKAKKIWPEKGLFLGAP